jgi:hypothetical protein
MARKKTEQRSFNDVLARLGTEGFDVSPAKEGSKGGYRVSRLGCAAEIAPDADGNVEITARAGWVLNGQIARILDRGYQKFLKTPKLEIAATADHLRAIHQFSEELKEATGAIELYNEALGTTSDRYLYDRVQGRE